MIEFPNVMNFCIEQRDDLVEAKETLFQVIDEMDEEMKRRFQETFEGVRFHFESVFKELFGGGRADLRLTNSDDLLNTGVDIVAQPPGKKLQNLGLLSGGERASYCDCPIIFHFKNSSCSILYFR